MVDTQLNIDLSQHTKVEEWDNGYEPSDYSYIGETLYRTESNNYYLHRYGWGGYDKSGGSQTEEDKKTGRYIPPGEKIEAYTEANARMWLMEKGKNEDVDSYFS